MLCYKDMTFCRSDCKNSQCFRFFSEEVREGSRKWWSHDPDNAPIAFANFSNNCDGYIK